MTRFVHFSQAPDELSISGETLVGELKNGEVVEHAVHPSQFGLDTHPLEALRAANVDESKALLLAALENRPGPARDIVALNAGATIYVAGLASTHEAGVARALEVMASGAARSKVDALVSFTRSLAA